MDRGLATFLIALGVALALFGASGYEGSSSYRRPHWSENEQALMAAGAALCVVGLRARTAPARTIAQGSRPIRLQCPACAHRWTTTDKDIA